MNRHALMLSVALLSSACYSTTIRSGLPASPATVAYDQRWHHGLFLGIAELSSPYDLTEVCPQGWAEIETEQSFLNGLLTLVGHIYTPQTVTIRCAALPRAADAAKSPPPRAARPSSAPSSS